LISLGGVVDKRWITTSDPENLYFDVRNHKKSKNKYDNKCTLDVWEKIVKKCG
jgi:hypothetical protein